MDFIKRKAKDFTDEHFLEGIASADKLVQEARNEILNIDNKSDKIKFLNLVLEKNNLDYLAHLKVCTNKEECPANFSYEKITYYLSQELARLGIQIDEDTFTKEEKEATESKLDQILKELNELKLGQQIIFEELNEMRELYFLGKKKWYQLLVGKGVEMAAGGIISETLSKQIIAAAKLTAPGLLQP